MLVIYNLCFKFSVGDPDPQIRDSDPRIFTGIQIRDPESGIRPYFQRIRIRDPRENSADLQHWFYIKKKSHYMRLFSYKLSADLQMETE